VIRVEGERSSGITITTANKDTAALVLLGSGISAQAVSVQIVPRSPSRQPWSERIAESFLIRHPGAVTYDSLNPDQKWNYEQGLMLVALYAQWKHTGLRKYLDFIRENLDQYVDDRGNIKTYKRTAFNLDNIGPGRVLLAVYRATGQAKYRAAADSLWAQLQEQPRTQEGGFWHKKIYPYQMWLDGLFMAEPFAARYASMFQHTRAFDDIANQFVWAARHTYDSTAGLFYHGWDESRSQRWADPVTGRSPNFWGRAMGWYAMGLVDVLSSFPADHPRRQELLGILRNLAAGIVRYQDQASGLWFQVVDKPGEPGNYREASASAMFAYSLAKGVNEGYLDRTYWPCAERAFQGIIDSLVTVDRVGLIDLHGTCRGAGLGGKPYRDGSYEYYVSEPTRTNDKKGYGPFLMAAIELERGGAKLRPEDRVHPRTTR
jgi:unsaturated rhamnogalacturonyl hydrolase